MSREPGGFPIEVDLNIDELVISLSGLGPLDTDCVRGGRSITPNSDVLGVFLSDGLLFNVRGPGDEGRVEGGLRTGSDRVLNESLGGSGGGSIS